MPEMGSRCPFRAAQFRAAWPRTVRGFTWKVGAFSAWTTARFTTTGKPLRGAAFTSRGILQPWLTLISQRTMPSRVAVPTLALAR